MGKLNIFWKWKSKFHKCCRNFSQKFRQKIPATSWKPTRLQIFWHAVWQNSINYSRRYSSSKLNKNETSLCQYHHFFLKLMLISRNWFIEGWGGAPQVWAGKKLFSTNQSTFTQKTIFDQAHPLQAEINLSKLPILAIFRQKKSEFCNCCRNFGQKFLSKFLATCWGPPNLEMSGDAILWNSMHYS